MLLVSGSSASRAEGLAKRQAAPRARIGGQAAPPALVSLLRLWRSGATDPALQGRAQAAVTTDLLGGRAPPTGAVPRPGPATERCRRKRNGPGHLGPRRDRGANACEQPVGGRDCNNAAACITWPPRSPPVGGVALRPGGTPGARRWRESLVDVRKGSGPGKQKGKDRALAS